MKHSISTYNTPVYYNDYPELDFVKNIQTEFTRRYGIDAPVACDMALDLFEVLTVTNCNLREIKSFLTQ